MNGTKTMADLRALAKLARHSRGLELKISLTPDEADSIADKIDRLVEALERIKLRAETEQIGSANSVFKWIEMVAASAILEATKDTTNEHD